MDKWNEIIPGLYMGGHWWSEYDYDLAKKVVVGDEFPCVVTVCDVVPTWSGPRRGIDHQVHPFRDSDALTSTEKKRAFYAAGYAAGALARGKVLVRCQAGLNRSGLVVAIMLMHGPGHYSADEAVAIIRRERGPDALHNKHFVDYLHRLEDLRDGL